MFWLSSRYYSPELCRFISPDSVDYLEPESINGLNLYCYCLNNPIIYKDSNGKFPQLINDIWNAFNFSLKSLGHYNIHYSKIKQTRIPTIDQAKKIIRKNKLNTSARGYINKYVDDVATIAKNGDDFVNIAGKLGKALTIFEGAYLVHNVVSNISDYKDSEFSDALVDLVYFGIDEAAFWLLGKLLFSAIPGGWIIAFGADILIDIILKKTGWLDDIKNWVDDLI